MSESVKKISKRKENMDGTEDDDNNSNPTDEDRTESESADAVARKKTEGRKLS
jgi:hypothetical protein